MASKTKAAARVKKAAAKNASGKKAESVIKDGFKLYKQEQWV
jgi:hypothetical protein